MANKNGAGRPTALTPDVEEKIVKAVAAGNYYDAAAAAAGVSYRAFRFWMLKGEKAHTGKFFQFFQNVRKAEAEAEIAVVEQWREAIPDNPAAARDFLARRYPDRWGPKERHEVTGKDGKDLLAGLVRDVEQLRQIPAMDLIRIYREALIVEQEQLPPPAAKTG